MQSIFDDKIIKELHRCSVSPRHFARNYIKFPDGKSLSHDVTQAIGDINVHDKTIVKGSRQIGKTTTIAAYSLWAAMFRQDRKILIASYNLSLGKSCLSLIRSFYETIPEMFRPALRICNSTELVFDNGSSIIVQAAGENTGRGMTLSHVFFDEFAFWSEDKQYQVMMNLLPVIEATKSKLVIMSSVAEKSGLFEIIYRLSSDFKKIAMVTFMKSDFARFDYIRKALSQETWEREYLCKFTENTDVKK